MTGTRYSSSIFPNWAPPGQLLLLNFIGGATNPGMLTKMDSELIQVADRDLRKILINPNANNPTVLGVKLWPKAIPQFLIGHVKLLNVAKAALKDTGFAGMFLGENYMSGVALGACVEGAYELATKVNDVASNGSTLCRQRGTRWPERRRSVS
ncbi:Protoporphyrinogen oxidase 1 [Arachis hypogaea]|nr:Protoporphyrinogen oxidase 1 [Arachis hypogaea]